VLIRYIFIQLMIQARTQCSVS